MSAVEINIGFIVLILIALALFVAVMKYVQPWRLWLIPIVTLLFAGLIYSIIFIIDMADGKVDPQTYNYLNNFLRFLSYATIIGYALAFLANHNKVKNK